MNSHDLNGYETHFYCALCGGPFAQVYRTAAAQSPKRIGCFGDGHSDPDDLDLDLANEFNAAVDENIQIPEEIVLENMGYAASRDRHRRITEATSGLRRGIMSENRRTFKAYDGRLISVKEMKWLRNLRALIHKRAQYHPVEGVTFLENGNEAYLTGKGSIRQIEAWADAFASVELEDSELPLSDYQNNQYRFQVYQELDREYRNFVISSIPFHSSCWDILFVAIEISAKERAIEDRWVNEWLLRDEVCDHIWGYLRGLVGVESAKMVGNMLHGERRGDLVTRLGEVDYREAQGSGEGWQWRHDEGLHWIVADPEPEAIQFSDSPLILKSSEEEQPQTFDEYPQSVAVSHDSTPILSLPPEIIMMIFEYLTSTDIFSFKLANPVFDVLKLPSWIYERFVKEEFKYFPALVNAVEEHNRRKKDARLEGLKFHEYIDWERTFLRIKNSIRTPRHPSEWDEIDISLKNRRRIWKIVKPMAEELVETTPIVLNYKYNASAHLSERISVVRGCVGTRSGKEGEYVSAYFAARAKTNDRGLEIEGIEVYLEKVRVYLNAPKDAICGLHFYVEDEEEGEQIRRFGRRSIFYEDVECVENLIGFVFCFTEGVIGGIQFVDEKAGFSDRIGRWDGVVRKIVAPPEYRRLVGITGFVNSSGFIEKIGLLEETFLRRIEDDYGRVAIPPTQVALSHDESTVWNRLPPPNVRLVEREGLKVRNWRLHMAEWEVWARGYEEEGVTIKSPAKRLCQIVGHFDHQFLRGLAFVYEAESTGEKVVSVMGASEDQYVSRLCLCPGENIAAVVLSTGVGGVHGILFVTDRGRSSDLFGPRYLGSTHKVFGPISDAKTTGDRTDIQDCDNIIGLHCLFDHEARRFLQLGLILPENYDHFWEPQIACSIPFDEVDDNGLQWEDGPPPKGWDIGQKHGVLYSDCHTGSKFAGYVDLSLPLKEVVSYGRMDGIKFVFVDDHEKSFGNTYNDYDTETQFIRGQDGERVIGVFSISEDPMEEQTLSYKDDEREVTVSASSQHSSFMQRLWFLTNRNAHIRPPHSMPLFISEADSLCGLKFEFNAHRLQACLPIYDTASNSRLEQRFPWSHMNVSADQQLSSSCSVTFKYFNDAVNKVVDAVRGYITSDGAFCGLLFRRNNEWDDNAFGGRSAFEITVELSTGETIAGAWISGTTALSFVTNTGKCTPWFGKVTEQPEFRGPTEWQMPIGVYGTIEKKQLHRVNWNILGLLYGKVDKPQAIETPIIPWAIKCDEKDPQTGLPWMSDINNKRLNYKLEPLASERLSLYASPSEEEQTLKEFWRTYISFEPCEVEQVRVFVNRNPCLKGLRALRVIGTKRIGLTTMGEWPNVKSPATVIKRPHKMKVQGTCGEKIVALRVFLRCSEGEDKIVGLTIETSMGRMKELYSTDDRHEVDQRFGRLVTKRLECEEGHEIVGFHGIVSALLMHNIGLVVRPISGSAFALPSSSGTMVKSQSRGCTSSKTSCDSRTDETGYTEATIFSPEIVEHPGVDGPSQKRLPPC